MSAADRLEEFRKATGMLKDLSFDSISAAAGNAAIPHYHVTPEFSLPLGRDEIYLIIQERSIRTAPPTSRAPPSSGSRRMK